MNSTRNYNGVRNFPYPIGGSGIPPPCLPLPYRYFPDPCCYIHPHQFTGGHPITCGGNVAVIVVDKRVPPSIEAYRYGVCHIRSIQPDIHVK